LSIYTTDTHALIYYACNKHSKMSRPALKAFEKAEKGNGYIYIPAATIWEISYLEKEGQIKLKDGYEQWMDGLLSRQGLEIVPLTEEIIRESRSYGFNNDIFDHVIVATAVVMRTPLITRDSAITESKIVEICW
jgi:PIN domain nuclease of toxin-antitoxin system